MLGGCAAFGIYLLFSNQLRVAGKILARVVAGCVGFWLVNIVFELAGQSAAVGVNPLTAAVVGLLGMPGFVSLYVATLIL
jgi:hypothetical protein